MQKHSGGIRRRRSILEAVDDVEFDGFEWDEAKAEATLNSRGVGFLEASGVFDGAFLEREDRRRDYGEPRFLTIGEAEGRILTVAWSPRARNRRIISAWPASNQERRAYREHCAILE